ncbi:uncharacterized protein LOC124816555 [Hydra vulgaris]|uniref:uncharacterized protein LOC124816555 n=1 Tax=Hydra vulgaris TaxID=6087 RepID=UPI001F5F5635|nr:uncharacterized protein LOC124816555 [Hydra vulgaris]
MGRTAKKKMIGQNKKKRKNTERLRYIYPLKYTLGELPQRQLPSNGDILRYYQFILRESQVKYKPTSTNVGCKLKSKSKDLVCENGVCTDPDNSCLVSRIKKILDNAGFGKKFVICGYNIKTKIIKLNLKYKKLIKLSSLNWNSSLDKQSKLEKDFLTESYQLFDILTKNFKKDILADRLRTDDAKLEDINFYEDQKLHRKGYMETKVDEDYSRRVMDANRRKNKLDKLREKELERQKNLKDINDVLLSHDSMTEEIQFISEEEKSNEDSEISEEDDFLGNGRKRRYNSGDRINLAVNVEKLIECTAIPATRFNVGVRPHLAILSEVFKAGGIEINDIPLSRSTLHRKKFKYVELEGDSEWISISNHLKGRRLSSF